MSKTSATTQKNTSKKVLTPSAASFFSVFQLVKTWGIIGAIILFICALWMFGYLGSVLLFLAVGCIVAFICSPIVNSLENHHISRGLGSFIALVLVLCAIGGIFWFLGPLFVNQLVELLTRVPVYSREIISWITNLMNQIKDIGSGEALSAVQQLLTSFSEVGTTYANEMLTNITNGILPNIMNTANGLFVSFLGIILAFWLVKDYPKMMKEFANIAGPRHRDGMTLLFAVTSRSISGYMKSIVITSVFDGVLAWIGFMLVGQPYASLMGILTAILHFIPVVGPFMSAAIATVTAFFVSPICAFWTLVVAIVAGNITDNVLSPVVMKRAVRVHPAMSLLAIVIGYALGGGIGMAISIPVSAAIKGIFIYYFETKTGRQIVSPDGALFEGKAYVFDNGKPAPSFDALDDDTFYIHSKLVVENEEKTLIDERKRLKNQEVSENVGFLKRFFGRIGEREGKNVNK